MQHIMSTARFEPLKFRLMVKRPQKNLFHLKDLCMDINLEENRNIVERFIQYKETGNKQVHVEINEGKVN